MPERVRSAQNISRMCMVCGVDNRRGCTPRFYELDPVSFRRVHSA